MVTEDKFDRLVRSRWAGLAVALLAVVLYLPSLQNTFAMDDDPIASSISNQNPELPGDIMIAAHFDKSKWDYFTKFFEHHYWYPESHNDGLFRPISVLSYGLVYQAIGIHLDPENEAVPQHLVNVLLHGWAVLLVIAMLGMLGASRTVAAVAGLLFGLQAIHSEVVAGVIGRAEMFSFCFGAQASLWMLRGAWWRFVLAGFFLFLAFGSKEVSLCWIPFYFCLVLARGWHADASSSLWALLKTRAALSALIAMAVPLALWFALRGPALASDPILELAADFSSNPLVYTSPLERIFTGIKVLAYGMWLCVVPHKLSCIYSPHVFSIVDSPMDAGFLAAFVVLLSALVGGLWFARRKPLFFLATACFFGFTFLTSNVPMAIGTIFGERLYYTPSLGVCIALALGFGALRGKGRQIGIAVLVLWCIGNVVQTSIRVSDWRSDSTIFYADVETYPMAIDLHRKAGTTRRVEGDYEKAIWHFREAIRLHPNYAHGFRELGKTYFEQGEWDLAIEAYQGAHGQGYEDPPGAARSIAFTGIGRCYLGKAMDAKDPAEKRRHIAAAQKAFVEVRKAEKWGESQVEAKIFLGHCYVRLARLEKTMPEKVRVQRLAITEFLEAAATPGLGHLAQRKAYKAIFEHAFEPTEMLERALIERLYMDASRVAGDVDYDLALLMGAAAYKSGMDSQYVLGPLGYVATHMPEARRTAAFYLAQVFYSDALNETGQHAKARAILEMLLTRDEIDGAIKQKIRAQLNDPNSRGK